MGKLILASLLVAGMYAQAELKSSKVVADCEVANDDTGLESLTITEKSKGKLVAEVEVSGADDDLETYKYSVKLQPTPHHRLGAPTVYSSKSNKFELNICFTCAPLENGAHHGSVTFIAPKSSEMNSGRKLSFEELSCTLK